MYRIDVFENVYPILEDTKLTINMIDRVLRKLVRRFVKRSNYLIIDIGSGSGILTIHTLTIAIKNTKEH